MQLSPHRKGRPLGRSKLILRVSEQELETAEPRRLIKYALQLMQRLTQYAYLLQQSAVYDDEPRRTCTMNSGQCCHLQHRPF